MQAKENFVLTEHSPILDGFRGLAIILVLLYHSTVYFPDSGPISNFLSSALLLGWSGVDMFFVLSGFLITSILLKAKEKPHFFKNFYMRRILRIFPLYYLYLVIALGIPFLLSSIEFRHQLNYQPLTFFRASVFILHFSNYLNALDGFQNYWLLHVWSLAVEEQFYMAWPFLVFCLSKRKLNALCVILIIAAFFFRWQLSANPAENQIKIFQFTHCRMDGLLMGCLVALNAQQKTLITVIKNHGFKLSAALLILILTLNFQVTEAAASNGSINGFKQFSSLIVQRFYFPLLNLFYTILMASVYLKQNTPFSKLVNWSPLQYLGRLSYGIYIYHMPILWLLLNSAPNVDSHLDQLLFWLAFLPLPVLIAHVSMTYYERPFLNLKRYFEH